VHTHPFDQIEDIQGAIQVHLHCSEHLAVVFVPGWLEFLAEKYLEQELLEAEALGSRDLHCMQVLHFFLQSAKLLSFDLAFPALEGLWDVPGVEFRCQKRVDLILTNITHE